MARNTSESQENGTRKFGRIAMGAAMVFAGVSHLTFARRAFRKQVPKFVPELLPVTVDQVVVWSGVAEIGMERRLCCCRNTGS